MTLCHQHPHTVCTRAASVLDSVTTAATALLEGLLHPAVGRDAFDQAGSDVNTDSANAAAGNVTTSAWESMQVDCTHTAHTHTHCTHTWHTHMAHTHTLHTHWTLCLQRSALCLCHTQPAKLSSTIRCARHRRVLTKQHMWPARLLVTLKKQLTQPRMGPRCAYLLPGTTMQLLVATALWLPAACRSECSLMPGMACVCWQPETGSVAQLPPAVSCRLLLMPLLGQWARLQARWSARHRHFRQRHRHGCMDSSSMRGWHLLQH
jgi:hypothetical protein